ncbi:MAG: UpxY family transcription antiterminator [Bacteroidales bacterium]|nr:UpxY family transcription antiterminator [Bacteroidales bacterium]
MMGEVTRWYAARTRYGQEPGIHRRLETLGIEHFIPPVISNLVFLRTTKSEACGLANSGMIRVKYIVDCATKTLLVVPDKQMEDFKRVLDLDLEEGGLVDKPLSLGEWVRVTKGALRDVEGRVLELRGRYYVVVGLLDCCYAKAQVPRSWLEIIEK